MTNHPHGYPVMLGLFAGLPFVASILAPVVFVGLRILLDPLLPRQQPPPCSSRSLAEQGRRTWSGRRGPTASGCSTCVRWPLLTVALAGCEGMG